MSITTKHSLATVAGVLLLALLGTIGVRAEDAKIIVWLNDGNKSEVLFADMPVFVYQDGNVTMKSSKTELSWPIANLQKLTFEDLTTGDIKATGLDLLSEHFDVYDLNGKLIRKDAKSLSELPQGTYVVKDGSVTIKVVRK
jgi:hypothetical protein